MTALTLITAGSQAVTTADAKAHLAVTHSSDDALIEALVLAAQAHVEQALGAPLSSEVWEQSTDGFPYGAIKLLKQPLTEVASVKYDVDGVETTLSTDDYRLDLAGRRVWTDEAWPAADDIASVRVQFTAGYIDVPAPLKAAVLLLVGDLYANREAKVDASLANNPTIDRLLWPYRAIL